MSLVVQISRSIQLDVGIFNTTYLSITSVAVLMQKLLIKGSPWALINRRIQAARLFSDGGEGGVSVFWLVWFGLVF